MLHGRVLLNPKNVQAKQIAARYKIVLVGSSGSGKTSLLLRFADNIFNEQVTCTLNVDQRTKQIKVDARVIKLQIWDTAGQERFFSLSKAYLRGAQGCIAVYDITRRDSFEQLESQILDFLAYTKDQSNLGAGILVGGHGSRATAVTRRGI